MDEVIWGVFTPTFFHHGNMGCVSGFEGGGGGGRGGGVEGGGGLSLEGLIDGLLAGVV